MDGDKGIVCSKVTIQTPLTEGEMGRYKMADQRTIYPLPSNAAVTASN